jgi:hypothetical protein
MDTLSIQIPRVGRQHRTAKSSSPAAGAGLIEPAHYTVKLRAGGCSGPDFNQQSEQLPLQQHSTDGDVTAPLVYVNYGLPKDYELDNWVSR